MNLLSMLGSGKPNNSFGIYEAWRKMLAFPSDETLDKLLMKLWTFTRKESPVIKQLFVILSFL